MKIRKALISSAAFLALSFAAAAQPAPSTQCVTSAQASGTGDALTIPLLPCATTTNLLILTLTATNTTTGPTLQMPGFPALPILNFNGALVAIGQLAAGSTVQLTATGNSWLLYQNPLAGAFTPQLANKVLAGPATGGAVIPAFRSLVGADLPAPTVSSLGGVESAAGISHQWLSSISTSGVPGLSQPAASDLSNGTTGSGASVLAASPTLTGVPLAPTATAGSDNTQIATTAYADLEGRPSFAVILSTTQILSLSGDWETVVFNNAASPRYDTAGTFNTSTGLYLIPVAGLYQFCASVSLHGTWATGQNVAMGISKNGVVGVGKAIATAAADVVNGEDSSNISVCGQVTMTASDTAEVDVNVTTTSATGTVEGNAFPYVTFIGHRLSS